MADVINYKDLKVWKMAMNLTDEIYRLVKKLPKEEIFCLSDQMRRAAVSIASNIAEGHSRGNTKEYIYFLRVARGSCSELETQLLICVRQQFLERSQVEIAEKYCKEIGKMINGLINKL